MPAPFDYTLNARDPVDALFQGMAQGDQRRAAAQDLAMGEQTMGIQAEQMDWARQDRARAIQEGIAERKKQVALQQRLAGLAGRISEGNVTAADFAQVAVEFPEFADELSKSWEGMADERKQNDTAALVKGITALKLGRPDIAITMLEERAAAAEAAGDKMETDVSRATIAGIRANPEAAVAVLGTLLHATDSALAEEVFGAGKTVSKTDSYADGTAVLTYSDGSREVKNAAGETLTGQAATDAVKAGIASEADMRGANAAAAEGGKLTSQIDLAAEAEAAKAAGKQAIEESGKAFESLGKVNANILTIDTAVAAIDAGANSGAIARYFPDISASSAALTNAMNRLGLDVISSVTFGALSEGEMALAMETAVPRNLDEPALRKWLLDKKAAQEKAAEALYQAAVYLGKPGNTLAKWLAEKGSAKGVAGSGSPVDPAAQGAGGDDLDALLREAEGLGVSP